MKTVKRWRTALIVGAAAALLVAGAWRERPSGGIQERSSAVETAALRSLVFEPFGRGLPTRGQWRNGFAVADMNGDGHPDIVHGPPRKVRGGPVVFLGDGRGGWTVWKDARFPAAPYDYGTAAVADFNGD